ncbi:VirK/YbjX family protein [Vibrio ishigakensis]|uniref:VirK/YbjX family protein n=1 Tax=Vibrio ishigakensis TaxID=1481914 RepID=UPI0021C3F6FB|nr:VirK/YbjX family protein [Vibrio ishigakensis]
MYSSELNSAVSTQELAKLSYPSQNNVKGIWLKSRFFVLSKVYRATFSRIATLTGNSLFRHAVEQKPRLLEKALKPYLYVDIPPAERMRHIEQHFTFLNQTFGHNLESAFENGLTLFELTDSQENDYKIILFDGEMREGSLGIRLINSLGQTIYSITFNLTTTPEKTIHIGALKGPSDKVEDRNQVIKTLTRSFHGLRPKALMVELALFFARALGYDKAVGVSNKGHIYQALRYKGSKNKAVTFNYDELWDEYGATAIDKYRFEIPTLPERKDPSTLAKRNKRRLYTKRYAWLDEMEVSLKTRLEELKVGTSEF